jgi:hypothetical protein
VVVNGSNNNTHFLLGNGNSFLIFTENDVKLGVFVLGQQEG